ncbi:hypothetical protein [Candidatus Atelocyanobacterium thalassae]|uniref:Peptidase n=2 Tax=Candidatus Atelocyanobacterium thalassae TaxID=713887 RepID=A0ABM7U5C8_9CHRO|nr:hypothetical protein [Candidatus Atelocyanobacterium thalassa]KFF42106.1 MAG: putative Zn-dependent protease [Candidatus Atelocyanobacterium thalassa isolate SIO64986]BDA39918.1 hypothetical protein CPARK_000075800 [cyanobacterium endosymbiont of Braarudosphaera bigelowii]
MVFFNYLKLLIIIFGLFIPKISTLCAQDNDFINFLSLPQTHPLPITLKQVNDQSYSNNYLNIIKSDLIGYLVWSRFPVKVYIDKINYSNIDQISTEQLRINQWFSIVKKAIFEWSFYLPIVETSNIELAEIIISRTEPPLMIKNLLRKEHLQIIKAKTAQTSYKFYIHNDILLHSMMINISSNLGEISTLSAARHELGHGLGIWGHSMDKGDVLYYSSTNLLTPISSKDINTLKQIYKQPTRLGWKVFNNKKLSIGEL